MTPSPIEPMYTTPETAKMLNKSEGTLPVWRSLGKGPAYVKIGARVFYPLSAIEEYLNANRVDPTSRD